MNHDINKKYNVAAPRYTSYPTVPYWDTQQFEISDWRASVQRSFLESNQIDGISLYIHLPYCESLCTYCGCNTRITKNHGVEVPYINALLKEWQLYCEILTDIPVIREIHIGGGTPTFFNAGNLKHLIEQIVAKARLHADAEFSFEAHPANTTTEHLHTLYNLGFKRLSLGIQDFDPKVQMIINRHQTFEQVKKITDEARIIGYTSINFDLIYGLPLQTLDGLFDTINQVAVLRPERIAFYSYAHVPWIKPGQRLFTEQDLPGPEAKSRLYDIGRKMFIQLGYVEIGMDHFALPGDKLTLAAENNTLHRNFMGYTHQHTQLLIGLGVSAISDSLYAFAQNAKTVEDYIARVSSEGLPVVKGHYLNSDDLIIRKHILNLMCKGATNWKKSADYSRALFEGFERLKPLAADGLVTLDPFQIRVTSKGKRFVRNICMALDARLWQQKSETQIFSMAV